MARQNKDKKVETLRLGLFDNRTHKQLWGIKFSRMGFIVTGITSVVAVILLFYCIFAFTPVRRTIPGYPNNKSRKAAIENAIKVDSLERIISRWQLYSENLRRVMEGEEPVRIDSIISSANANYGKSKEELTRRDSILRRHVIDEEQFELSNKGRRTLPIEGIHFFTPLKGVVSQGYDEIVHPYIDINAPGNSVVMSVLDGTVIFSGWSDDAGYMIHIQHDNDIVSIYKHNSKLLVKTRDKVSAGTPIALIGNTGKLSTGEHLHFELWYKGEAINPTKYINF